MLKRGLERDSEVKPEMNAGGAEVEACLVEPISLPVMIISRSLLISKREPRFEGVL